MRTPLPGVTRENFVREALAGVTLLAIAVPLNIGYAQIAGLAPVAGLYALVVPTIVYALLVSSRQVVASPDAAAAALVFASLTGLGIAGDDFASMAAAQAILCGVFLVAASVLRLGFLANFLSRPILVGFVSGLALEVLLSQVAKMLGIRLAADEEFFAQALDLALRIGETSWVSLAMSAAAVMLLLLGRRFVPSVPGALVVLVGATVLTVALRLDEAGVAVLGVIDGGPPEFAFPALGWAQWLALVPSALALAMITMAEGVLISRSYADTRGYPVSADRDLLAFGAANVAAGISMSFSMGSSTSRTAAMDQLGSRTQLPSLVLAGGSLILLLVGTELLAQIPSPVIGAVVAVAVIKLIGLGELRAFFRLSRYEFGIAVACLLGVLIIGPLGGLFLAFFLALVNLARRASNPEIDVLHASEDPQETPVVGVPTAGVAGVLVIRFAAPLFFANGAVLVDRVAEIVHAAGSGLHAVVIDAEGITDVDVTGAEALRGIERSLRGADITIAVSRLRPGLRERFAKFDLLDGVVEFDSNRAALSALTRGTV
ncbi:SulP family inorganic anion transporter [Microbacterium sp. NPDC087591]|uniref:SulP family inorganic anion transporter n=1 Tax=Microbacterium sp. NPDC087591 TaxID=3364192 RepID=UPI0038309904